MPLDGTEKGPGATNTEARRNAKRTGQTEVTPDARRAEPVLRSYIAAGHELVPLNVAGARDRKGRPIGKAPMHKNWRTAPALTIDQVVDHMERFGNIGVRLRPEDLVIDVDPRNFEVFEDGTRDDPLARLEKDLGLDLRAICPTVVTGSGGLHLYLRKPADVEVRDSLEEYQGVEFKTFGRQVVAPGSIHPEAKKPYLLTLDDDVLSLSVPIDRAPQASAGFLGMIRRPDIYQGDREAGDVDPEALALMLDVVDVTQFTDHQKWLEMMMACHHATAGDGRQEFLEWTTSDPVYGDQAWSIGRRWDSLKADSAGRRITKATLFMHVLDAGKTAGVSYDHLLPVRERDPAEAAADFADVIGDADTGDLLIEGDAPKAERHFVDEMNDRYCGVLEGGKFRIFREFMDTTTFGTPRRLFARLTRADFLGFHEHHRVMTPDGPGKSKAELWLKSPKRRTYEGLIMAPEGAPPGMLNLWKGWAVEAKPGDWSKTRALIYDVLASGDGVAGDYIIRWMAYLFQKPHLLPQVALVFRGGEGVGKGTLGRAIMDIVGTHGLTVSSTDQFAGRFDAHLRDCIFLFADEALWGGDKQAEGKLKQLITEPVKTYEAKGVDASSGRNLVHLMMASNNEWVAPAGPDARRFAVFDVSDARKQDRTYFGAINDELYQEGGLSAMLHDLLSMDLGNWRPYGNVPRTEGRSTQKLLSLDPMPRWWFRALEKGSALHVGLWEGAWDEPIVVKAGKDKDDVLESLQDTNPRRTFTKDALGKFLCKVGVDVKAKDTKGNRIWLIPPLPDARKAFADWLDEDLNWED